MKLAKAVFGACLAFGLVAMATSPASATYGSSSGSKASVTMTTLDATKGACTNGKAPWDVRARVDVRNRTSSTITVKDVGYVAAYAVGDKNGYTAAVQATSDGGLRSGATIAGNATRSFSTSVRYSLPCGADDAVSLLGLRLRNDCAEGATDCPYYGSYAQFISDGSAVPSGAIGILGLSALGAAGLAVTHRRSKRRPLIHQGELV